MKSSGIKGIEVSLTATGERSKQHLGHNGRSFDVNHLPAHPVTYICCGASHGSECVVETSFSTFSNTHPYVNLFSSKVAEGFLALFCIRRESNRRLLSHLVIHLTTNQLLIISLPMKGRRYGNGKNTSLSKCC